MRPELFSELRLFGLSLIAAAIACGAAAMFLAPVHVALILFKGQMSFPQGALSAPLALVLTILYVGTFSAATAVLSWGWMALVVMLVYAIGLRKYKQLSDLRSGAFAALLGTLAVASATPFHRSLVGDEVWLAWSSVWVGLYAGLRLLGKQLRPEIDGRDP